jgi:hypothetical protein
MEQADTELPVQIQELVKEKQLLAAGHHHLSSMAK